MVVRGVGDDHEGAGRNCGTVAGHGDPAAGHLRGGDPVTLGNDHGRFAGRVFLAPIARGNLQVHWPEGNVLLGRGVLDATGGVPDYNARVRLVAGGSTAP